VLNRARLLVLVVAPALLLAAAADALAKSYRHPNLQQTVTLFPDGTLDVLELRSYAFDGEFHNANVPIIPRAGGEARLLEVRAVDDGGPVRDVRVEDDMIRWRYDARDETRTFAIHYQLTGEIDKAADAALLDRLLVEEEHAIIDRWDLTLRLAAPANLFKVFVITRRSRVGEMDVSADSGRAVVSLESLAADEWVRVRVLLDPAVVPGLPQGSEAKYESWLRETAIETQSSRESVRRALRASGGASRPPRPPFPTALAFLLWGLSGAFSWWAFRTYRAHGLEPAVQEVGQYYREPAETIPPGAVPFVMDQFSPGIGGASAAFGSTLLDFARRGFVRLEEREKEKFLGLGGGREVDFILARRPGAGELTDFEEDVWRLLEEARGADDRVKPSELRKFFKSHTQWMTTWVENPRAWYERTKEPLLVGHHGGWMFLTIGGGIVLMAGSILLGAFSNNPVVFLSGILAGVTSGLFGVICGAGIPKWRSGPLLRARQWQAYKRFLSDFSAMKEAPAEHYKMWDYHFIYATALGVSKEYLAGLKKLMAAEPDRFSTPAWIVANQNLAAAGTMTDRLDSITANLASLEANLTALESALSTTTSSGGGFSGGGAGGASGGGSSGAS
jgi:hypothetical protein